VLIARGKRNGRPRMSRTDMPDAPIVLTRADGKVLLEADLTDFRIVVWHPVCAPASGN